MSPRNRQLVVCGLGGQGIVFLSRVIAAAAVHDGDGVLTAEAHGMAQRGGAVEAHLKIGDFEASLVRPGSADAAIALDTTRLATARALLRAGGTCFADATAATPGACVVDATGAAAALGFPRGRNLVLLGFAAQVEPELFPSPASILDALDALSKPEGREPNRQAFGRGSELA